MEVKNIIFQIIIMICNQNDWRAAKGVSDTHGRLQIS